ncbi:hypothetical protein NDR87_09125 [Nocardia sp. CDC159]|uniref:Uncharacterized protein n=1 Tax=Nocardia pulmonis TaxID=2951408 RepID=A0A9X2E4F0_9NOCA|nr:MULTISPECIES: hypothetical protein [Nocardia]MCM6773629.1 hypothetical protein [Nocardia pulmonis]MCM6786516.1 hypothetical protein [Nocardia sp. CDC159]
MNEFPPKSSPVSRFLRSNAALLILTIGLLVAVVAWQVVDRGSRTIPGTARPVITPTTPRPAVDLDQPFRDTPAASWAEGADGIVPPPPAPIGRYSAEQVADAMARAKQLIITARLDRHVLIGHDAEPVLAQLAPGMVTKLRPRLTPGNEHQTWWVSSKIASGYGLAKAVPRVTGSMRVAIGEDDELVVHTDYLVAYAFDHANPKDLDDPMDIVAVDRLQAAYEWVDDARYDQPSQGMWIGKVTGFAYSVNCALHEKGFLAPSYSNPPAVGYGRPAHPRNEDYFDPTLPIPTENNC